MLMIMTAMALAAAQTAPAPAQPMQMGQMQGMDHSKMDHSKMDHSKMAGGDCCKKTADGKMECDMSKKDGASSAHQDHSNH